MRAVRFFGVGIAALGIAATAAAPVAAEPGRPQANVFIAQVRYLSPPGTGVNGEYVKLTNGHNYNINLANWTLHERVHNRTYRLPSHWLGPDDSVWIYSGHGRNGGANLFWGSNTTVWDNNADTATVRNGRNTTIDTCSWRTKGPGFTNCP
ncbi:lamin tail domain-containing protein [Streptomyces sp. ICBB 8177]|uniref:lamin tail domain-containing protein n=1 Tax=Streptomyces sp. ICBB 8177 TaxID=563922 RepID=UPI000D67C2B5|nr:lamin tail domain-containing protein [Streptomyces sp. ICBB 8177]PWI45451.1 hypothetical protein CK485_04840 [Streptomyces sp. ICBB 8177]